MRRLGAALLAVGSVATVFACNMIVGVEDVTLRRDAGNEEDVDVPVRDSQAPILNEFVVALGDLHTCARKLGGEVRCWGDDTQGQTGVGTPTDGGARLLPEAIGISDAIALASGKLHSCAAVGTGAVKCWGFNLDGQLGNGETNAKSNTPVDVQNVTDARAVAAGGNFSCAMSASGLVQCWGGNASGQLGTGMTDGSATPVRVRNFENAIAIAAGDTFACGVDANGDAFCWGDGSIGQLGRGNATSSPSPVSVVGIPKAKTVTAGERHACSLARDSGQVHCWGANESGQLGSGNAGPSANPTPVPVTGLSDAIAIAAGKTHTCAVRMSGAVACWGAGAAGQLGDGRPPADASTQVTFVLASGITNGDRAGAGGGHSCATTKAGGILCWGSNARGQLGNGSTQSEPSPVSVNGL